MSTEYTVMLDKEMAQQLKVVHLRLKILTRPSNRSEDSEGKKHHDMQTSIYNIWH